MTKSRGVRRELIIWVDSNSVFGWRHVDECVCTTTICESVGFVIDEDKGSVALAQSRNMVGEGFYPYADIISIPKVAIKKRVRLTNGKS